MRNNFAPDTLIKDVQTPWIYACPATDLIMSFAADAADELYFH